MDDFVASDFEFNADNYQKSADETDDQEIVIEIASIDFNSKGLMRINFAREIKAFENISVRRLQDDSFDIEVFKEFFNFNPIDLGDDDNIEFSWEIVRITPLFVEI